MACASDAAQGEALRENARNNVEQFGWAANQRDSANDAADGFLARYAGDDARS